MLLALADERCRHLRRRLFACRSPPPPPLRAHAMAYAARAPPRAMRCCAAAAMPCCGLRLLLLRFFSSFFFFIQYDYSSSPACARARARRFCRFSSSMLAALSRAPPAAAARLRRRRSSSSLLSLLLLLLFSSLFSFSSLLLLLRVRCGALARDGCCRARAMTRRAIRARPCRRFCAPARASSDAMPLFSLLPWRARALRRRCRHAFSRHLRYIASFSASRIMMPLEDIRHIDIRARARLPFSYDAPPFLYFLFASGVIIFVFEIRLRHAAIDFRPAGARRQRRAISSRAAPLPAFFPPPPLCFAYISMLAPPFFIFMPMPFPHAAPPPLDEHARARRCLRRARIKRYKNKKSL